jgi:phenylacetate-CoA ligase
MNEPAPLGREELIAMQTERLRALLVEILPANRFHACRFAEAGVDPRSIRSLDDLRRLPLTTKAELAADQLAEPPYGTVLTYPRSRYIRLHQTSGTAGRPLRWLDTAENWQWMLDNWQLIYDGAGIAAEDRLFFPFSFGPFLGFWTAFEAAQQRGCLVLAAGGLSSGARLRFLLDNEATIVLCTPTYALHLAEAARQESIDLANSPVRALIVAGEPGGNIPATRQRLESAWGARVFDHSGMTEVGPCAGECAAAPGTLDVLETEYIAEVIDPETLKPMPEGQPGELVLTNLGRVGSPLIRYRTGDLVNPLPRTDVNPCLRLAGGILGRLDDMIPVRGNNVYPAALEAIVRRFPEVVEFRIVVEQTGSLPVVRLELEPVAGADPGLAERVHSVVRDELLFRADVVLVPAGSLPRFEMKARRLVKR